MSDNREAFERVRSEFYKADEATYVRIPNGDYRYPTVDRDWKMWQACAAEKDAEIESWKSYAAHAKQVASGLNKENARLQRVVDAANKLLKVDGGQGSKYYHAIELFDARVELREALAAAQQEGL